ncbi:MAG: hypothetical protein EXS05_08030 [Planctomycetaceae bacterium]|nr:hypothetical protein [Planctomycetaceae bacterium]
MWFPLVYYLIGVVIAIRGFMAEERKPADRLPFLVRLGVWANIVSTSALLWPLGVLARAVTAATRKRNTVRSASLGEIGSPDTETDIADFVPDDTGIVQLARISTVGMIGIAIVFMVVPVLFVIGCWFQERRISALFVSCVGFTVLVWALMCLSIRKAWFERAGLRYANRTLLWTEADSWTCLSFKVPLEDVESIHFVETDPIFFETGLALVLREQSSCNGNVHPRLESDELHRTLSELSGIDPAIALRRLIIWADEEWVWKPEQVAAWLQLQMASNPRSV